MQLGCLVMLGYAWLSGTALIYIYYIYNIYIYMGQFPRKCHPFITL